MRGMRRRGAIRSDAVRLAAGGLWRGSEYQTKSAAEIAISAVEIAISTAPFAISAAEMTSSTAPFAISAAEIAISTVPSAISAVALARPTVQITKRGADFTISRELNA